MMKYSIIILVFTLGFFSCSDSLLDITPQDQVSSGDVWVDPDLIELYVNGRYNELPHGFVKWAGGLRLSGITDETYFDGQNGLLNKYINGGVTASNMHLFGSLWPDAYKSIRNSTIFLESIQEGVGEPDRIAQLTAEIRFLRAWFYVELISRYGDVPLLTETFGLEDDLSVDRTPVSEVVDFVVQELDLAIAVLPESHSGNDFGRATSVAAMALKIRALMFDASPLFTPVQNNAKWQEVATACEELFVVRNTLSDDYVGLFLNPSDPEVLFFKLFRKDAESNFNTSNTIDQMRFPSGDFGDLGFASELPSQAFIDDFETIDGEIPVLGYTGSSDDRIPVLNADAVSYDVNDPYSNRDPRLAFSVNYDGSTFNGRELEFWNNGNDSENPTDGNGVAFSRTRYGIRKSLDENWTKDSGASSEQPWVYMRLAEFFLTYAEAQYHLGNTALAEEYVDKVRSRSGVNMPAIASSLSGMDLLDKIKHERKIELAFESNRWYDVRRWNDGVAAFSQDAMGVEIVKDEVTSLKTYKYFVIHERAFPEHQQLWPIPFTEISKTDLIQNPGY